MVPENVSTSVSILPGIFSTLQGTTHRGPGLSCFPLYEDPVIGLDPLPPVTDPSSETHRLLTD